MMSSAKHGLPLFLMPCERGKPWRLYLYSLSAFSVPLLPQPQVGRLRRFECLIHTEENYERQQ